MIKTAAIVILGALILVLGGIYLFGGDDPQAVNTEAPPWIEVLKPGVSDSTRQLKTGDELKAPSLIKTNSAGLANIYFPDGSVARLDSNTELVLEQGSYDSADKTLRVKILLSVGRVWSKIFELATPRALWEVRTANAVATVRGTAFGAEYIGGKLRIVTSENKIAIKLINPENKKEISAEEIIVSAGKLVEIRDEDVKNLAATPISIKDAPAGVLSEEWIKRAQAADLEINKKLNLLKSQEKEVILERSEPRTLPQAEPAPERKIQSAAPEKLVLETPSSLSGLKEGVTIFFQAVVIFSDGTRKNVTDLAEWKVLGPIGKILKPGVFFAQLDPSVAEFGISSGAVVASWKDLITGADFLGQTPIFNVEAKIEEGGLREG